MFRLFSLSLSDFSLVLVLVLARLFYSFRRFVTKREVSKRKMKFFFIILVICFYLISQTSVNGRATGLRKAFWPMVATGRFLGETVRPAYEIHRRQAGWGKRAELVTDDDADELQSDQYFGSARSWFDEK